MSETHGEYAEAGWRGRGDLKSLVAELERQKASKIDFVTDTRHLHVSTDASVTEKEKPSLNLFPSSEQAMQWLPPFGLPIKKHALGQLGSKMSPAVPGKFLNELVDAQPEIAADLLDSLMKKTPETRLIRCLDGAVRSVLSDRYRMIDNYDMAFAAMDVVKSVGGEVIEASLTDHHMRIKFTSRNVVDAIKFERAQPNWSYGGGLGNQDYLTRVAAHTGGELPGGPGTVHPLVTISNSEDGSGGFGVRLGLLQAICFNLATVEDVIARVHLGGKMEQGLFTAETIHADNRVLFMKARDAIRAAFDPEHFKRLVLVAQKAASDEIPNPRTALVNLAEDNGLSEDGRDRILDYFLRDYDQTRWGLAQAVARCAQDIDEPESATMMEELAGTIIRDGKAVRA